MQTLINLLKLARPYQYTKNLFIFIPAFFAFQLTNSETLTPAIIAFIGFSLVASSVYIFNDFIDRKEDAKHPTKKSRPLASGAISPTLGLSFALFILAWGG